MPQADSPMVLDPFDWRGYIKLPGDFDLTKIAKALFLMSGLHQQGLMPEEYGVHQFGTATHDLHKSLLNEAVELALNSTGYSFAHFTKVGGITVNLTLNKDRYGNLYFHHLVPDFDFNDVACFLVLIGLTDSYEVAWKIASEAVDAAKWRREIGDFDAQVAQEEMAEILDKAGGELTVPHLIMYFEKDQVPSVDLYTTALGASRRMWLFDRIENGDGTDTLRLNDAGRKALESLGTEPKVSLAELIAPYRRTD